MNRNNLSSPFVLSSLAVAAALALLLPTSAHAKGFLDPISRAGSDFGRSIGRVASSVGKGVSSAASNTAKVVTKGVTNTGKAVGRGAQNAGREVGRGAQNTGREVGRGAQNTGREVGRGAQNTVKETARVGTAIERFERQTKNGFVRNWQGVQPAHPLRLTVGKYFAQSKNISRGTGTLDSFDLVYDTLENKLLGAPTVISLFADVNTGGRYGRNNSAQYDADIIGIGVQARRVIGKSLERNHFYFGSGIGFYGVKYTIDPLGPNRYRKQDYGLGLRLMGGYQFSQSLYLQADILGLEAFKIRNANGQLVRANPSGARFGIGYRF